jgi:hypothetical protein
VEASTKPRRLKAKPEGRKVCIVGFSTTTRDLAPFDRPDEFEFWGMNTLYEHMPQVPRWDVWFDMHPIEFLHKHKDKWPGHMDWLAKQKIPIYMQQHYDGIPYSVAYPIEKLNKEFFTENPTVIRTTKAGEEIPDQPYFTNTVAQQMALAISMGDVSELHIYGIDMVKDSEWGYQRPNCEYFIGHARGKGIKVVMPEDGALCKGLWLYGFDEQTPKKYLEIKEAMVQRTGELVKELSKIDEERDKVLANRYVHEGARQENVLWLERLKDVERGGGLLPGKKEDKKEGTA